MFAHTHHSYTAQSVMFWSKMPFIDIMVFELVDVCYESRCSDGTCL